MNNFKRENLSQNSSENVIINIHVLWFEVHCHSIIIHVDSNHVISVGHVYHTFQLHKQSGVNRHRSWICEVINEKRQSTYYAFENEARRDSFAFFMITQRCLPAVPSSGKLISCKNLLFLERCWRFCQWHTLATFPRCNFSLEFPEILSRNHTRCHWLSVSRKTLHCGIFINMLYSGIGLLQDNSKNGNIRAQISHQVLHLTWNAVSLIVNNAGALRWQLHVWWKFICPKFKVDEGNKWIE